MKIAHLADLHLGFRAYHRAVPGGINAREADVANAFAHAVERLVALRPDLILVAGDVFHTVRPSNHAIANAFRQFSSLVARLPETPIVMIAGNHDSPRSSDTGNILDLFSEIPRVAVVTEQARAVHLPELDTTVLCLPHTALTAQARLAADPAVAADPPGEHTAEPPFQLEPDPHARFNVLMLHGTVSGTSVEGKLRYVSEFGGVTISDTAIAADRWDYVALGHYHIATELTPNMWYAGGIERTSTNIWEEAAGPKGFLMFDTDRRTTSFHTLETRPTVDLPRNSARGMSAEAVNEAIGSAVASVPDGIAGKMVRLVVLDIPRHVVRELDHRRIREWKAEALHFHLDTRPPQTNRITGIGAPMRRRTLEEQVESFLRKHWQPTSEHIQRDRLVELGREYLARTAEE